MAELIYADIQRLEVGLYVELFEMDLTPHGGNVYFFHGYTQIGPIYWKGVEIGRAHV